MLILHQRSFFCLTAFRSLSAAYSRIQGSILVNSNIQFTYSFALQSHGTSCSGAFQSFDSSWLTNPMAVLLSINIQSGLNIALLAHSTKIHVSSPAVETLGFFCWLTLIRGQRRSTDSWSNLKSSQRPGMAFPKSQKSPRLFGFCFDQELSHASF